MVFTAMGEFFESVPDIPFDGLPCPPAPDYNDTGNPWVWAAWPGRSTNAESSFPVGEAFIPDSERPCNCFYIPLSTSFGTGDHVKKVWNVPYDDPACDGMMQMHITKGSATVWNQTCRVFIPRYRQIALPAYVATDSDSALKAMHVAYSDVRSAFEKFLETIGPEAPFILAGFSQGALHGKRLLLEVVDRDAAVAKRMVAAYLIGNHIQQGFVDRLKHITPATAGGQIHVIIGWDVSRSDVDKSDRRINSVSKHKDAKFHPYLEIESGVMVTNPLDLAGGKYLGSGFPGPAGVQKITLNPSFLETVSIDNGFVKIGLPTEYWPSDAPMEMPAMIKHLCSGDDLHGLDIPLWYFNIRANLAEQARTYLETQARDVDAVPAKKRPRAVKKRPASL